MNENLKKLFDILLSNNPSILIRKNEDYIFNIIPELRKSKGFNQNNPWHIYDVYDHILHVIDGVKENIILRLAALFHDVGKPYTYMEDENNIGHFYDHWTKSCEIFLNFSKKYELPVDLTNEVNKLIYYHDINISKLNREELNKFLDEFSVDEINMLYEIKKSDLLAQSPKYHYLITEYDLQKENLLRKKIVRWKFCSDNEKLISLVLSGEKRATTSLYNEYIKNKEPLPKIGEKSIIQQNLKKIIGVIVVSVFAIITIYTVFRGSGISLNELTASLKEASWEGILLASVSMLGFIYFEGEALRVLVRHMGYPAKRSHGFVYSAADVYFSAITPSASGGQPASAYFMLKDGIAGTAVMAALLLNLIMYTLAILTIGLVDILIFPEVFLGVTEKLKKWL